MSKCHEGSGNAERTLVIVKVVELSMMSTASSKNLRSSSVRWKIAMIPPFDLDGDLPPGGHTATWQEFQERFCVFIHSDQRLQLCRRIAQLIEEARASDIVDRVIFGGSFVTGRPQPNDFDCIVVLQAGVRYEILQPFQRWVADTREATRRYRGDIFVARIDQPTLEVYRNFFSMNRHGKQVGLVEVTL